MIDNGIPAGKISATGKIAGFLKGGDFFQSNDAAPLK
jgi:hypothetical protein